MPTEQEKADLSKKRGQAAASIADPDEKRKFIAAQGEAEAKGKGTASAEQYEHLNKEADDTMATGGMNKAVGVPSYKKGTSYVPSTGLAKLHKGEAVIPAEKNPMNPFEGITKGDKKPPKKIAEIRSKKSHDGKIIHTHMHHHPQHHGDETYVSNNADEAAAHMTAQEPNMSAAPPEMESEAAPTPAAQ